MKTKIKHLITITVKGYGADMQEALVDALTDAASDAQCGSIKDLEIRQVTIDYDDTLEE